VDEDPAAALTAALAAVQAVLADPAEANQELPPHPHLQGPWAGAVDMIVTGDVLVHEWDLGQAFGVDVTLDPDELAALVAGVAALPDEVIRVPVALGPALEAPAGADEQTRALAFLGRQAW
jgi:uncharacterized protein (TIGR03086 family)